MREKNFSSSFVSKRLPIKILKPSGNREIEQIAVNCSVWNRVWYVKTTKQTCIPPIWV